MTNKIYKLEKLILLKQKAAYQEIPLSANEPAFKAHARKKQSLFRQMVLGIPYDPKHKFGKYGAFLMEPFASLGYNFCEVYRNDILNGIKERYGKLNAALHEGLMGNMLRSEHIPWNVFYPMKSDLQATSALLKDILKTDEIDKVTDIRIEWAPEKEEALDDNTSFDTYIEYIYNGKECGVGIEVKYTEEGYPFGKLERKRVMEEEDSLYAIKTRQCGLYTNEINNRRLSETLLCKDDYRQIWRNHLLGAAMVMNGRITKFHSITLYPNGNTHFKKVLPEYEKLLSEYGKATFGYITIEKLILLICKHFEMNEKNKQWVDYLNTRYPFI
ncbi:PGN_0703 family putative restriction endonuclease [Bacteroides caecigallinarum]|uniref:PGN_0703 family putative restriction endonuclease n=1 Tax=Bacteroides caecigallinarum TaxID=1411144 RepID=UPI001F275CB3|nr:hypothetical protein [Bacteroides caecigallinarum]MCF2583327.1 hypothetical protein [Bacteroides caecigallinarum]